MSRDASAGASSTSTALRSRQPTATQGLDGTKKKLAAVGDDRDLMLLPELVAQLVGHDGAAKSGPKNDNMRHALPPLRRRLQRGRNSCLRGRRGDVDRSILPHRGRLRLDAGQTSALAWICHAVSIHRLTGASAELILFVSLNMIMCSYAQYKNH